MPDLLSVDAAAMALLGHDVVALTETDLDAPTPCTGWTVADLIDHMNERHQAFLAAEFEPLTIERRDAFARIAARWGGAMESAGDTVHLPGRGPTPTERLLSIHLVDMLTHRWDLNRALGRPCLVPARLTDIAESIAHVITAPGNGPTNSYQPPRPTDPARPPLDNIVALLGRDPDWRA